MMKRSLIFFFYFFISLPSTFACDQYYAEPHLLPVEKIEIAEAGLGLAGTDEGARFILFENGTAAEGKLAKAIRDSQGNTAYLSFSSETRLLVTKGQAGAFKVLPGQGFAQHAQGFGMPVGSPFAENVAWFTKADWKNKGISEGSLVHLKYKSGVEIIGQLEKFQVDEAGMVRVLKFVSGTAEVRMGEQILFEQSWGTYDLLVGTRVSNSMLIP